ncbi:MAG: hypothetical protein JWO38_2133, partial [Gemmataceae bacterium]|nr:hypothetical protein [Gemmataceae bacterium]
AKTVVIDDQPVTVRVPPDLPDARAEEVRRTLNGKDIMTRRRRAIRTLVRAYPELVVVTGAVTP